MGKVTHFNYCNGGGTTALFSYRYVERESENMRISEKGLNIIKEFEGCRLEAYRDPAGVLTIGYGHTHGVQDGMKITQETADEYLRDDCVAAEKNVNSFDATYHWNQNQFDALVSFAFNLGSISQLTANGTRSIAEISAKIPEYCHAGGKKLNGLVRRRAAEKELFDTPVGTQAEECALDQEAVRSLQEALNADGITDADGKALMIDGIKGQDTTAAIKKVLLLSGAFDSRTARFTVGSTGQTVKWLQMRLNTVIGPQIVEILGVEHGLETDGKLGNDTRLAVGLFQELRGLKLDYKVGIDTITELLRML